MGPESSSKLQQRSFYVSLISELRISTRPQKIPGQRVAVTNSCPMGINVSSSVNPDIRPHGGPTRHFTMQTHSRFDLIFITNIRRRPNDAPRQLRLPLLSYATPHRRRHRDAGTDSHSDTYTNTDAPLLHPRRRNAAPTPRQLPPSSHYLEAESAVCFTKIRRLIQRQVRANMLLLRLQTVAPFRSHSICLRLPLTTCGAESSLSIRVATPSQ